MSRESPTNKQRPTSGAKVINQREGGLIRIGDSIEAVVLKARDGSIRVVISAPRHLQVSAPKQ